MKKLKDMTVAELAMEAENLSKNVGNLSQEKVRLEKEISRLQKDVVALDEKKENLSTFLAEKEKDLVKGVQARERKANEVLEALNARNEASKKASDEALKNYNQAEENLRKSKTTFDKANEALNRAEVLIEIIKRIKEYLTQEISKL